MSNELSYLNNSRKFYRTRATKLCTFVNENYQGLDFDLISSNLDQFKNIKAKLNSLNADIATCNYSRKDMTEKDINDELTKCDEYEDNIAKAVRILEQASLELSASISNNNCNSNGAHNVRIGVSNNVSNNLKLPHIPLPEYSNLKTESLERFFVSFESVVQKYSLNAFEKFVLLERQLKGEPLLLVKSLSTDNQSYDSAKELLIRAFANPINQKFDIIRRLTELKLDYPGEPYAFISEMRTLSDSLIKLKIDLNTILQYFVWVGLNDCFKNILINITNSTKPNFEEIEKNIFNATERYMVAVSDTSLSRSETSFAGYATNFQYNKSPSEIKTREKFRPCSLCFDGSFQKIDHPIYKCIKYPTPRDKIDRLKVLKCCIKCTYNNHRSSDCEFKFKRNCSICNKNHFDYLCYSSKLNTGGDSKPNGVCNNAVDYAEENFESSSITINSALLTYERTKKCILPTFVIKIVNGAEIRCLLDSGSQCNFIAEAVARKENLTIIEKNVNIAVNGFNSSHSYKTNVVKFTARFGSDCHEVIAICVPKISTSLKIPGLSSVAKTFCCKGINLADHNLLSGGDSVSNLDFILGSNSSYCIPTKTVLFGGPVPSSYLMSPLGAMLSGSIEILRENLKRGINYELKEDFSSDVNGEGNNTSCYSAETSSVDMFEINHIVLDDEGKLIKEELENATKEALFFQSCPFYIDKFREELNYETANDGSMSTVDSDLVKSVLDNTKRTENGRLMMPLMWNQRVCKYLSNNYYLARQILYANLRKLKKSPENIKLVDDVINDQLNMGIIEKIDNLPQFLLKHPESCFLAHMPIIKMNRETTKCRIVFLSNLAGKDHSKSISLSNNQCMMAGPCLNSKLSTSIIQLRFDKYLMCFDLVKAFLQIALEESDQMKLCFLWFRNPTQNDFTLTGFKNTKLSFGLKCSPTMLMLGLFKILMIDSQNDDEKLLLLKKQLYSNFYMDNGAFTSNDPLYLRWAYNELFNIFSPYKFSIQQVCTNDVELQNSIEGALDSPIPSENKLLGLKWNRFNDRLSVQKLYLDPSASTKREILRTVASNFDLYNFNGPLLNRARLFLHKLQCSKNLKWDDVLENSLKNTWHNITKQLNSAPEISIERFVGRREDKYDIIAFTDSSKLMCGTVVYLHNVTTNKVSYLYAKNKIVGKSLENQTIPSLEFQGVVMGAEAVINTYKELSGENCVIPIKIRSCFVYTDSSICLSWLNSFNKLENIKKPVFIMNRFKTIDKFCEVFPIQFRFCSGIQNPADCMTRELSPKQLLKSNFLTGPCFLEDGSYDESCLKITIPNPALEGGDDVMNSFSSFSPVKSPVVSLFDSIKFGGYRKYLRVISRVVMYINILKRKVIRNNPNKYKMTVIKEGQYEAHAFRLIVKVQQYQSFGEVITFFEQRTGKKNTIPDLVRKLNLYLDDDNILRVKSKFGRWKDKKYHPILLSKESEFTKKLVLFYHETYNHCGLYQTVNMIRKKFWINSCFSLIKKCLNNCIKCRRSNRRPVKVNQSSYRDFRVNTCNVPYRSMFIDYLGPFQIQKSDPKERTKVYLLCFTCLWSRAINLKICIDLSVDKFLRAFQLHCFEYGVPEVVHSDLGSQIIAGGKIIRGLITDEGIRDCCTDMNISPPNFQQFPKGCKQLGGIVECCVKMVKRLIFGSIGRNVLSYLGFEFVIQQVLHVINKRPVSFTEYLRDVKLENVPSPLTPEMIIRGYELPSFNLVPDLEDEQTDPEWYSSITSSDNIKSEWLKLSKIRATMIKLYREEFLQKLIHQATDKKDRYSPIKNDLLKVGDIVMLCEENTKRYNFPMAIVMSVVSNYLGEVTSVEVLKGNTRERVTRHVTSVIPLLSVDEYSDSSGSICEDLKESSGPYNDGFIQDENVKRNKRTAAVVGAAKTKSMSIEGLV